MWPRELLRGGKESIPLSEYLFELSAERPLRVSRLDRERPLSRASMNVLSEAFPVRGRREEVVPHSALMLYALCSCWNRGLYFFSA